MKLVIFGATGGTGSQLVRQALAAGHEVTAVARRPEQVEMHAQHERLRVLRGDVMDAATVTPAVRDADAVVSALGSGTERGPVTLYSVGVGNIIQAMRASGEQRLISISAGGVAADEGDTLFTRIALKPILQNVFKGSYTDMARMEEELRQSDDLDWTIVRPPRLTNKPYTGHYRTALNRSVRRGNSIARADLADAILHILDDPKTYHAIFTMGY